MKCFVENCSTSYNTKLKKNEKRKTMFRPRSTKILEEWRKILIKNNEKKELQMKSTHVLCELHFKEEDIERERIIHKYGGIVERQERKIPLLKDNAVPCIFSANLRSKEGCAVEFKLPIELKQHLRESCIKSHENTEPKVSKDEEKR